ncbi:MAG: NAD(P)/FAD-dependent oxidoreductase [Chloroflexota bacterium]
MDNLKSTPLTVIGSGPAGLKAAQVAAEAGVEVTLIDENGKPGGQYYRQSPDEFQLKDISDRFSGRADAKNLFQGFPDEKIRTFYQTMVWGVFEEHNLALTDQEKSFLLPTELVILATGAYDRPMAFPGWTLPGILGAGAALRMIKSQWILPGKKVLLAGLGPLQLALAEALIKSGAEVVGIAEAANPYANLGQIPKLWGHWDRIQEAVRYYDNLRKHKVPLFYKHTIIGAEGEEQVKRATIAQLDHNGKPIHGTEKNFEVDAVCLGYGLLPSIQVASGFNCRLKFDTHARWFVPSHDANMETSQPGIYVAGDMTRIAGSKTALVEGEIAGLSAAFKLGAIDSAVFEERLKPLIVSLHKLNRLTDGLQHLYPYQSNLDQLIKDDTLICRCEEVTVLKVKEAIRNGATDINQVKLATRAGMGYCQGRFCSVLIASLISEMCGTALSELQPFTIRPPFQPLPLNILAFNEEQRVKHS